ncbi:hypothetical protein [Tissierella praeacuta]
MPMARKEVLRNMINDGDLKTAGDLHPYLRRICINSVQYCFINEYQLN